METDVLIIGCGPAGLQAAIHSSRNKVRTLVVGKMSSSSLHGTEIENYMGVVGEGDMILSEARGQAASFGAEFIEQNVISSGREGDRFKLVVDDGTEILAKAVVIATGISRKKLGVPGEKELYGKGVSYCAMCDCNFYKGRRVVLVGNESEAAVSSRLMTSYASETSWVAWDLTANEAVVNAALDAGVRMYTSKPRSIDGTDKVESITLQDGTSIPTDGVFIELGAKSAADIAMDLDVMPEMDDTIKVDPDCRTEVPGVFACGDVTGKPWQVAKAVGQGCVAGIRASEYVKGLR
ncbi:thioredoxin-disulfide reductase TrxB [methanogenic archaeon mixed culture ISO4-G1]|jgi:thioredoxin reductase (NADPH)|nr:thioredoxin-disulfide reductase TrxB [methanogenic archaeon mixed culture ISO4-G1]